MEGDQSTDLDNSEVFMANNIGRPSRVPDLNASTDQDLSMSKSNLFDLNLSQFDTGSDRLSTASNIFNTASTATDRESVGMIGCFAKPDSGYIVSNANGESEEDKKSREAKLVMMKNISNKQVELQNLPIFNRLCDPEKYRKDFKCHITGRTDNLSSW